MNFLNSNQSLHPKGDLNINEYAYYYGLLQLVIFILIIKLYLLYILYLSNQDIKAFIAQKLIE